MGFYVHRTYTPQNDNRNKKDQQKSGAQMRQAMKRNVLLCHSGSQQKKENKIVAQICVTHTIQLPELITYFFC